MTMERLLVYAAAICIAYMLFAVGVAVSVFMWHDGSFNDTVRGTRWLFHALAASWFGLVVSVIYERMYR